MGVEEEERTRGPAPGRGPEASLTDATFVISEGTVIFPANCSSGVRVRPMSEPYLEFCAKHFTKKICHALSVNAVTFRLRRLDCCENIGLEGQFIGIKSVGQARI